MDKRTDGGYVPPSTFLSCQVVPMRSFVFVPLLALALATSAHAGPQQPLDLKAVATQQQQIRADILASGGKYRGLSTAKQEEVLDRSGKLLRMIEGKQSPEDLTEAERMQAFNTLEWIEATLNKEDGERMVCNYHKTIGSNRKTRVCKTAAQIERDREEARQQLSKPGICAPGTPGCSGG